MSVSVKFVGLVLLLAVVGCGPDKLPSRDHIPVLKQRLYALEQGLVAGDRAALDSMMSVKILDVGQDSDSLLRFVYGADGRWPFHRLGDYNIFFSNKIAVINCYIMDTTEQRDRPLKLMYELDDQLWLLTRFDVGDTDTTSGQ